MRVRRPAPNTTLNLAPFGRWTLRDEAAQRRLAPRYPDAMRQGNVVRVLQSLYRRFAPYNNSLEHTAKISARLRLSSTFSGAQLAPR